MSRLERATASGSAGQGFSTTRATATYLLLAKPRNPRIANGSGRQVARALTEGPTAASTEAVTTAPTREASRSSPVESRKLPSRESARPDQALFDINIAAATSLNRSRHPAAMSGAPPGGQDGANAPSPAAAIDRFSSGSHACRAE